MMYIMYAIKWGREGKGVDSLSIDLTWPTLTRKKRLKVELS